MPRVFIVIQTVFKHFFPLLFCSGSCVTKTATDEQLPGFAVVHLGCYQFWHTTCVYLFKRKRKARKRSWCDVKVLSPTFSILNQNQSLSKPPEKEKESNQLWHTSPCCYSHHPLVFASSPRSTFWLKSFKEMTPSPDLIIGCRSCTLLWDWRLFAEFHLSDWDL